uniref:Uncharacterized protein n=1 Tax=Arundo donax TaxID=35708 RepID=A0A0A9CRJ6_ARUDO
MPIFSLLNRTSTENCILLPLLTVDLNSTLDSHSCPISCNTVTNTEGVIASDPPLDWTFLLPPVPRTAIPSSSDKRAKDDTSCPSLWSPRYDCPFNLFSTSAPLMPSGIGA